MNFIISRNAFAPLCLIALLLVTQSSEAQRRGSTRDFEKNNGNIKRLYAKITEPFGKSTVRINSDNANIALGTIVDADGLIVTKASEIANREIKCMIGEDEYEPEVIATDDKLDLALLKVGVKDLKPVEFAAETADVTSGQFVVSVDYDAEPESIGVITVKPRRFSNQLSRRPAKPQGYLGVESNDNPDGDGVVIARVSPRTAASRAGLRSRDIILEISGSKTNNRNQLSAAIKKHAPGDEIAIKIKRGDNEKEMKAKLGDFSSIANQRFDRWGGGPFSTRRFNFPTVIAHDSVIRPNKMGGPLVNLDGKVVGINIARALRVSTYALQAKDVLEFVRKNKSARPTSSGK